MKRILCTVLLFFFLIATVSAVTIVPLNTYLPPPTVLPTPTLTIAIDPNAYVTINPSATPTSWYGSLRILSEPSGAILGNNISPNLGYRTPFYVPNNFPPGEFTFHLRYPGYEVYTTNIVVQSGRESVISATLIPLPEPTPSATVSQAPATQTDSIPTTAPATTQQVLVQPTSSGSAVLSSDTTGSLSITTIPAGGEVSLDDEVKGISPALISGIPPGTHSLKITKGGYQDFSTSINIEAGKVREYSTGLIEDLSVTVPVTIPSAATTVATTTATSTAKSPGFAIVAVIAALFSLALIRKRSR